MITPEIGVTPQERPTPTQTDEPRATATATQPSKARPTPTVAAAPRSLAATSALLRPASVTPGATLTATISTAGPVRRVEMYIGSGIPSSSSPITISLTESGAGTWTGTATAPSSGGQYHYSVGLYDAAGRRTIADNDSWNITVTAPSAAQVQPLPADIPLVPPFSYGNPVAAVFSAEGRTVSGSEVVSNARPDVAPSTVSAWYVSHLPRAGWTVDSSTIPAAGATAFTIVATSGQRACVVEFGAGTVHVFYGTFSG